ncbi:hypothetical protein F2Q68_00003695 [Brassica cretica]|uniref:Uncharacterized protein n=2 Tax=Brassica cretica TaxID=69181 RepID=A0A8S9J4V5_BRACR|nr:hypothetical protein F2Q68_00003695 [Brassica cretica]
MVRTCSFLYPGCEFEPCRRKLPHDVSGHPHTDMSLCFRAHLHIRRESIRGLHLPLEISLGPSIGPGYPRPNWYGFIKANNPMPRNPRLYNINLISVMFSKDSAFIVILILLPKEAIRACISIRNWRFVDVNESRLKSLILAPAKLPMGSINNIYNLCIS